jgi:hypothetical protein
MPSCQDSIGRQKKLRRAENSRHSTLMRLPAPPYFGEGRFALLKIAARQRRPVAHRLQGVFCRERERVFRAHLEQRASFRVIRKCS